MGVFVHRMRANYAVAVTNAISGTAALLVAVAGPQSSYWKYGFPTLALNPIGAIVLFTVSNFLISSTFPDRSQVLAGGVFNTPAQAGKSVDLAVTAVIAGSITLRTERKEPHMDALMNGYKAAWWFCFAVAVFTVGVSARGLRSVGELGQKRE